jgi:hypothetical protein
VQMLNFSCKKSPPSPRLTCHGDIGNSRLPGQTGSLFPRAVHPHESAKMIRLHCTHTACMASGLHETLTSAQCTGTKCVPSVNERSLLIPLSGTEPQRLCTAVSCLSHPALVLIVCMLTTRARGADSRAQPDLFSMPALLSTLGFISMKSMFSGAASGLWTGTNRARSRQGHKWARRSDSIDLHRTRLQATHNSHASEDAVNVPSAAALLTVSPGPGSEIPKDRPLESGQQ